MADDYKLLYQGAPGTSPTTLYTVPAAAQAIIRHMVLTNPTGASITFAVYRNGLTSAHLQYPAIVVPANDFWEWHGHAAFDEGETLGASCDSASGLATVDGDEVTA